MNKANEESTITNDLSDKSKIGTDSDFINLEKLRLSQNYQELIGVRKALLTVPVRKPGRQEFFRVHPAEDILWSGSGRQNFEK